MLFSSALTYGDFYRTGVQDCGNVLSIDEFDLKAGTPKQIVEEAWAEWEEDGMEEQWLEQQDDFEGLDAHKCYENWKAGWKSCAVATIEEHLERYGNDEDTNENPPPKWWHRPSPGPRACYRTKADALKAFLDTNSDIVENYGGADYEVSPSEFDAINHKYDLKGKRAARSIADAVWAAMPIGRPYCLDRIDVDALNDTSPAREAGVAFRLPDINYELQARAQEAAHYAQPETVPDWVTEHEHEAHRVFPPLPSMEGIVPFGARLERREPGVETYQLYQERPLGPPPSQDVKPVRLQLEGQEPGVATFKMFSNPAGQVKIKMTSTRSGNVAWIRADGTPSDYESEAGHFDQAQADAVIAEYTAQLVRVVGRCANRFETLPVTPRKNMPTENPAWVTKILSKHFVALEEEVPPKWLPKLTKPSVAKGKLVAAMKEYGCGAYGCVLPTLDPSVVLKLTTDDTEAEFAHDMAAKLTAPVVVKYHLTRALPDRYRGRGAFLLWRDSADMVGDVAVAVSERGGDGSEAEDAIGAQHKAAQDAFDALHHGKPAEKLLKKWEEAARAMGKKVPELRELADGMITNLYRDKVFMGDVHSGNIGRVKGHWVVVDPGHIAVLQT